MATTLSMTKDELLDRATEQMRQHLTIPNWSTTERVALTARVLFSSRRFPLVLRHSRLQELPLLPSICARRFLLLYGGNTLLVCLQ